MKQKTPRGASAVDKTIGTRIRIYRQERNLSQTDLGRQLDITFQQVQKYESGANRVSAARLLAIAHVLAVPLLKFYPDTEDVAAVTQGTDPDFAPVSAFMASADGWRLCRAFVGVADPQQRRKIIALVEDLLEP